MPNIAIIDDDTLMRDFLEETCLGFYKDRDIEVQCFRNGTMLLESKSRYDLIFLDIELGIDNGIEIAKKLREKDKQVQIVIVSGFEKYKSVAYSIHCFDYLDKPVTPKKIIDILQEFEDYKITETEDEFIILKVLQGIKKIYLSSVRYIEYKERKIFIYTTTDTYNLYGKLQDLFGQLQDKGFGHSHRAYIVNFRRVSLIQKQEIILDDATRLPLSKSKRNSFLEGFKIFEVGKNDD